MGKKKISIGVWLLGLLIVFCFYIGVVGVKNRLKIKIVIKLVLLGDFFILLYDGIYYVYGMYVVDGIEVYILKDFRKWKLYGLVFYKDDVWVDSCFWVLEIYEIDGKFYMYYMVDEYICVVIVDFLLGLFRQNEKKLMVVGEKMIDSFLFIDEDGKFYFFFVCFNDGNNVWVVELEDDYMMIKMEMMCFCIYVLQVWEEVWLCVNEGFYVFKYNGLYYMIYFGNSFESLFYGIGCVIVMDIMGEWIKYQENLILQKLGNLQGVGYSVMFKDKKGRFCIVYYVYKDKEYIYLWGMYIGKVYFEKVDGIDCMWINKEYIVVELVE